MPTFHTRLSRAALFIPFALLAACGPKGPGGGHGGPGGGMPPALVAVEEVKTRTIPVEFEYPAQTAGSREVEVRARVSGILLRRNYTEGSIVPAGQSLFTIDPAPYEAVVARSEADVVAAQARESNAERNARRLKPLYDAKAVSQKDYDDAVSAQEVADADVKSAKARLQEARLNLGYTAVVSPVTGATSRAVKSEGSLIAGPQDLLTTVSQVDPIYANFGMSESEQLRLRQETAARKLALPKDGRFEVAIKFEDGTIYQRGGRLAFTDIHINPQTGTSDARAELANPAGEVRPGQFVRVILKGAQRPDAIAVPQRAVMEGPQGKLVYLLGKEGKAEPRPVTVGEWVGSDWIITSGLNPGEKVIVDGLMKVFPGAPVQIGDPNAPPPGAPGAPGKGPSSQPAPKAEGTAAKPGSDKK